MKMVLAIRERFRRNWYINSLEITKSYKSHDLCLSEDSGQFSLVFLLFLPFFSKSSQAFLQSGNKNWRRKMFKIIENFKILDLGFVDNGNLKGKISQSPKQGASDPICRLIQITGLCVYLFYPNYFLLKSTSFLPPKKTECPLNNELGRCTFFQTHLA